MAPQAVPMHPSDAGDRRYLLEMRVNPRGELQETTTANNVARRRIRLGGRPGRRTVRVAPWRGIRD